MICEKTIGLYLILEADAHAAQHRFRYRADPLPCAYSQPTINNSHLA